jgi:hypothetical protein
MVCCEHGIITHDGTKNEYWVPYDKYRVIARNDATFPISYNLQVMHDKVLAGSLLIIELHHKFPSQSMSTLT